MFRWGGLLSSAAETARESARTWSLLTRPQHAMLLAAAATMACVGGLTSAIPVLLGKLVDSLTHNIGSLSGAFPLLAFLGGVYVAREALQVLRKICVERTCTDIERDVTVRAVSRLLQMDLQVLHAERKGTLNGRLSRSIDGLVKLLKLSFLDLLPALFGAFFALVVVWAKNPLLGLVMTAVVPVGLLVILAQLNSQRGIRLSLLDAKGRMDGTIVEQIDGIDSVRAAHTIDDEVGRMATIANEVRQREFKHHIAMAFFDCAKMLNEGVFHIAVITVAVALAIAHQISTGDVLAFSMLFLAVVNPLREVHRIFDEAHESSLRARDLFEILHNPVDISFEVDRPISPNVTPSSPAIEIRNLTKTFNAGSSRADGRPALDQVSLSIAAGEFIGFAGPSGSGKSTLFRVLLRLTHAAGGKVNIAGVPLERISRADIGRVFGYLAQEPHVFHGTIAENIAYGCGNVTTDDVRRAARLARIDDEIEGFPAGYSHMLSERGNNLSGGQRQRIALARVFLKNPPILLLDEATAALDNDNERRIMEAIDALRRERTVLMIAHRLQNLKNSDRIYVLKQGRIAEQGSYEHLAGDPRSDFHRLLYGEDVSSDVQADVRQEVARIQDAVAAAE